MDRFLAGFTGVGLGFLLFMPSYLFTRQSIGQAGFESAPITFKGPMFVGMGMMLFAPAIFWGLLPIKDHLLGKEDDLKV